ncbi:MAG: D-Ala-D-Ala carboxypeptidase family metallohydrolase [Pseudomonadota bacterium]
MTQKFFTQSRLDALLAQVTTTEQLDAVEALWKASKEMERLAALRSLRANSVKFLAALTAVQGHVTKLSGAAGLLRGPDIEAMEGEIQELHRLLHHEESLGKTFSSGDTVLQIMRDEEVIAPAAAPVALPAADAPLETPTPINSSNFAVIADEYVRFFLGVQTRPTHASKVAAMVAKAVANRPRYEAATVGLGVPWWFVAGLHQMEATYNFGGHLHNGDPLRSRTIRVPAGRPTSGTPPFSWEESAADALRHQRLDGLTDWSLPRALWRWERYNGFGYRSRSIPKPYLWSFSSVYLKGKFTSDGRFDGNAGSAQSGAAVLLKALMEAGHVTLQTDMIAEAETDHADAPTAADSAANTDGTALPTHPFARFFADALPDVDKFEWREFLYKGASHAANGLNADPPEALWQNVVPLARALQAFREAIGKPVVLTSIYRSPEYNAAIGGAGRSQHMAFRAADFKVVGAGRPTDWARKLRALRDDGVFSGGVGVYNSFVHIDTRGMTADW